MTTTVTLKGLDDQEGETLAVFLAGLDCGDHPVIGGWIVLATDGTLAGGLLTERYLTQVSAMGRDWGLNTVIMDGHWSVPCVVGYRYKSRGQRLRPVTSEDTGALRGPGFGKFKRTHELSALLQNTAGISFGTSFDEGRMFPMNARTPGERAYTPTELFSGVYVDTLEDEASYDSQLCWEVEGPYSAQICALGGFITTEDR